MMIGCAASTGPSRCDERVRVTAAACGERPGHGRGDLGAASPDRGPGAAAGYDPAAVLPWRPGVPGRPAAPAPTGRALLVPAAGAAGDGAALASRPGGAPACGQVPPQAPGPAAHRPLHPPAGAAPGRRTRAGATGAFTANCSCSGSGSRPPPCGRSFSRPGSARRLSAPSPPGPVSSGSQADALLACDFFETVTLSGARLYVLAVIEHASRRIRILGATPHPTASWVARAARNLVMDLQDAGSRARFLIRDRDGKFPGLFGAILADAGIETVLSGVQMPRMNALAERWVQTCRRELLDRTLILGPATPAPRTARVRAVLQLPPPSPGNRERPATARAALTDPRAGRRHPPPHKRTRPPRRHPPRVPTCRLTCTDEIFGGHNVQDGRDVGVCA